MGKIGGLCLVFYQFFFCPELIHSLLQQSNIKKEKKHNSFYISACDRNATLIFQEIQDTPESLSLQAVIVNNSNIF